MKEVHNLTNEARELASRIQDALDILNYAIVRGEIKVMLSQKPNDDTIESLISGATFDIPDPIWPSTDNSLLHVAIHAGVDYDNIMGLLKLGVKYSLEWHNNSLSLTPSEYGEILDPEDRRPSMIRTILHPVDDRNMIEAIEAALHSEQAIVGANRITVDMAPQMPGAERSMFNKSVAIDAQVEYFIDHTLCPDAHAEYDGTMITFISPNNIENLMIMRVEDDFQLAMR